MSIKTKAAKINQKLPTSNIVPNKDTCGVEDKREESKNIREMPAPESIIQDFGKIIFPSKNLAIAQKTILMASPKTKSRPLEASTGMFVKGRAKRGSNTTTKNNAKNESLSNMFEFI